MIDGEITEKDAWRVRMHIGACSECAQFAKTLKQTAGLLREAQSAPMLSSDFDKALAKKLSLAKNQRERAMAAPPFSRLIFRLKAQQPVRSHSLWRPLAFASPVAAAVVIAMVILFPSPRDVRTPGAAAAPRASFTAKCVSLHETETASQPLSDPSAQMLLQSNADDVSSNDDPSARSGAVE